MLASKGGKHRRLTGEACPRPGPKIFSVTLDRGTFCSLEIRDDLTPDDVLCALEESHDNKGRTTTPHY